MLIFLKQSTLPEMKFLSASNSIIIIEKIVSGQAYDKMIQIYCRELILKKVTLKGILNFMISFSQVLRLFIGIEESIECYSAYYLIK